jgi:hypothetical protein
MTKLKHTNNYNGHPCIFLFSRCGIYVRVPRVAEGFSGTRGQFGIFIFYVSFLFFKKYTMNLKFGKTILQLWYHIAVGTNRHETQRLEVLQCPTTWAQL